MHVQSVLPRDAIQSIDDPAFDTEYFGDDEDEVLVIEGTPSRAYPIRLLNYHEIVNDVLDEQTALPVAVTWCPLCASAAVYERTVDGRVLTSGTSGKLADDALVMYDHETESEWKQPLGRAISGPLDGAELSSRPMSVMTWTAFQSTHPDGVVLQPVNGGVDDPRGEPRAVYDTSGYDQYDASPEFGVREMRGEGRKRTWGRADIEAKTAVVGVVQNGEAVGYPRPVVDDAGGVVTDSVGGTDVLVVSAGRLAVFENPGYDFASRDGRLVGDGTTWNPQTGESSDGRILRRLPARYMYAFAWQDDHGPDRFYGLSAHES